MAKTSSTVHLEDSTWQEIKEYQNKYKCSRNEAIERMFVERRLLLKISCKSATEAPKKFKEKMNWEKLNLSYLSSIYGFEHKEVHRAWSDAEVNAHIYFALNRLAMHI